MDAQKTARVVIGAQFGDEGKGRFIDDYAASAGTEGLVIRFNGGAQAGHTVVTPAGLRHVFSHVGSGALVGAATFLSCFFVSHPILFLKERAVLATKGVKPLIYVDPQSPVTTPYDMMMNQFVEQGRGADRHGSCGIGFGETIERHENSDYRLTVADLAEPSVLVAQLDAIRRDYVPMRLARLGFEQAVTQHTDLLLSKQILQRFIEDTEQFLESVIISDLQTATRGRQLLFEGAQGLWLDQDRGFFPHVTRSNTGLYNVLALIEPLNLSQLEVTYVTRPYVTRHGAGPLPHELSEKPYAGVVDATNIPNPWQGSLRFAWLDLDLLCEAIARDLALLERLPRLSIKRRLAMTCLDQIENNQLSYYSAGRRKWASIDEVLTTLASILGLEDVLLSWGLHRNATTWRDNHYHYYN